MRVIFPTLAQVNNFHRFCLKITLKLNNMRVKICTKNNGYRNYGIVAYTKKGRWFSIRVIALAFGYKQLQFSFKIKK